MAGIADEPAQSQLPARVQSYIEALVRTCGQGPAVFVSLIVFGSSVQGGFSGDVSDVDLIIVVADATSRVVRNQLRRDVARVEIEHQLRAVTRPAGPLRSRVERAVGHGLSGFVCTRRDLLSGDVARVLDLRAFEAPFVDRIVLAAIISSAATVWGEDLLPRVAVPRVRRLDVFKALFGFCCQLFLSAVAFALVPEATRYAMGVLKHSLHSCYFCYHGRAAALHDEVEFFRRRLGASRIVEKLLLLRVDYHPSFGFVVGCLPVLVRLHLRTARDNHYPLAPVRRG